MKFYITQNKIVNQKKQSEMIRVSKSIVGKNESKAVQNIINNVEVSFFIVV